jgi:hypothetical protein
MVIVAILHSSSVCLTWHIMLIKVKDGYQSSRFHCFPTWPAYMLVAKDWGPPAALNKNKNKQKKGGGRQWQSKVSLFKIYGNILWCYFNFVGRNSSVGIATGYRLDGPGIETRWERDFPHPSRPALGPTQQPIQWVPGLSWGVKLPERGVDHPPQLAPRLKKE